MKIKSIRFLNLNSLRGEHEINFDAPPLSDSGLFAITGPTGAGKTTILDAITLGLYGCVNRHATDLADQIMTRHTAEAFSEVTFEAGKETYRAKWQVYRSRKKADGKLQQHTMELCRVSDGTIFDLKSKEVPGKVSELCCLDYSQFLRSVMLSQGEFTRFLKASENDRSELLERITDTGIYSSISREAYRKAALEKQALNLLRSELSGQTLLAPEVLSEHETSLENLRATEFQLKQNRSKTETEIAWLQTVQKLSEKKLQTQNALTELETNAARYETDFARLEEHKIAVTFRPDLVKLEREQQFFNDIQTHKNQLSEQLPALKSAVENSRQEAEQAKMALEISDKTLKEIAPLLDDVLQKDTELENLRRHFLKNKEAYQSAKTQFDNGALDAETYRKTVADLAKNVKDLKAWLEVHASEKVLAGELNIFERHLKDLTQITKEGLKWKKEKTAASKIILNAKNQSEISKKQLAQLETEKQNLQTALAKIQAEAAAVLTGTSEAELEKDVQELPVKLNQLDRLNQVTFQAKTLTEKLKNVSLQKTEILAKLLQLQTTETVLSDKLKIAQEFLQQYQEIADFQLQVQNYEEARKHLQPDCECPLCGALEHPFAAGFTPKLHDAATKRNTQQKTVAELEKTCAAVASERAVLQANLKTTEVAFAENQQLNTALEAEFTNLNQKLHASFSLTEAEGISAAISANQEELKVKKQQLEQVKFAKENVRVFTEKQYRLQEEILRETSASQQNLERKKNAETTLQQAETELLDLMEQHANIFGEAASFCSRFNLQFSAEKGTVLLQELKQTAQFFIKQSEQFQLSQLALSEAKGNLQKAEATQQQKQEQLNDLQEQLRAQHNELQTLKETREALFGQKNPVEERAKLTLACDLKKAEAERTKNLYQTQTEKLNLTLNQLTQLQHDEAQTSEKLKALQTALEGKLAAVKIASVAELKALFLADEEAENLANQKTQLEKLLTETRQTLADTASELKAEEARNLTSETVAFLTENLQQTDRAISESNQQIGSISQILKREKELQEKHAALALHIANQQKETERWEKLSELIGSDNGKKFSKFAQGLTLAKLVHLANRHLLKLNDRYQLQKSPNTDLELQMIDTYQADAIRSVNTLSGGESFLVSLALALGLSDLASHKTQIDSLFIDEGFGTLDAETLDIAISALENLQASGKMIGIISHVEALKERISTQIQVKKLSGGVSKIEVSAYSYDGTFA